MMIEERSGSEERAILTGMLTNRQVCARLAQSWTSEGLFRSRYANLVAGWAVAHFNKYGDAIGPQIELQLATYASQTADKETLALVESLVAGLSNDWQGGNVSADYLLDIAQKYTAGVAAERAILQAQQDIKLGNVDEAISRLSRLSSPIVSSQQWIDPFTDREAMRKAWETSNDPLIVFPGPIGELFKNAFRRDSFIAFRAVAKAGKSFNLLELAYRAVLQGRRVAYFCIGDMSEAQVLQRLGQRVAKRPLYAGDYSLPSGWDAESPTPFPILKPHHYETDLTWEEAANAGERFIAKVSESGENLCRLSVHASGGLNTIGLNGLLTQWAIEGWNADCIAEGSLVLTDRGEVPIENVLCSDRLWDGENWVSHDGPICKGERDVITYAGITATPDHRVFTEDGWRTIESCRSMGLRVAQTGVGGTAVRLGESYITDSASADHKAAQREAGPAQVCLCSVCAVRSREVDSVAESEAGDCKGMPRMSAAEAVPDVVLCQGTGGHVSMHESKAPGVAQVWGEGDTVSLCIRDGSMSLDHPEPTRCIGQAYGAGSDGERWPLRAGESTDVHTQGEHGTHLQAPTDTVDACLQTCLSCGTVFRQVSHSIESAGAYRPADCGSMESTKEPPKKRVWDILNAGPLHRFTVSGVLVHNCVLVDYADLLGDIPGTDSRRESIEESWRQMRAISQRFHCCLATATQSNREGYNKELLDMDNFNGSRTQNDNVTAIYSINQTTEESAIGIQRIQAIANRDNPDKRVVACLGARSVACPIMFSMFCEAEEAPKDKKPKRKAPAS